MLRALNFLIPYLITGFILNYIISLASLIGLLVISSPVSLATLIGYTRPIIPQPKNKMVAFQWLGEDVYTLLP